MDFKLQSYIEDIREEFVKVLRIVKGNKVLIIDNHLIDLTDLFVNSQILEREGVIRFGSLQSPPIINPGENPIFFLTSELKSVKRMINLNVLKSTAVFTPRITAEVEELLEYEGVYGILPIYELELGFLEIDKDVLSLGLPNTLLNHIEGDLSPLKHIAQALIRLESVLGIFPMIYGIGPAAHQLLSIMKHMEQLDRTQEVTVDRVIIIDRNIDRITPLMTQLTYSGLLDEMYSINHNILSVKGAILGRELKTVKMKIDKNDSVYMKLRDINMGDVGNILQNIAKSLSSEYSERHNAKNSIHSLQEFVSKLPDLTREHRSLQYHISLTENLIDNTLSNNKFVKRMITEHALIANGESPEDYIELMINRNDKITDVLRLLCLWSLINRGLKKKKFDLLRKKILQAYGYHHIITLLNLERLSLLSLYKRGSDFSSIKKKYNLFNWEFDNTIHSAYSGYCPISVRYIENILKGSQIPDMEELSQYVPQYTEPPEKTVLILFIGGVARSEISALRILGNELNIRIIVSATDIISGKNLIKSFIPSTI